MFGYIILAVLAIGFAISLSASYGGGHKPYFALVLVSLLICTGLSGCGQAGSDTDTTSLNTDPVFTETELTIPDSFLNEDSDTLYETAREHLNNGNFSEAREIFAYLDDYQNSKLYIGLIDFIEDISGDYYFVRAGYSKYTFQIASDSVLVSNPNITYKEKYGKISFSDDDEYGYKLLASDGYGTYEFVKIDGAVYYRSFGDTFTNSTSADETEFTRLYRYENGYIEPKAPEIGMTADEVRNSTWDEPKEIDKTTTKYGVREQWVYSSRRYIYLEDGIVVAIQE